MAWASSAMAAVYNFLNRAVVAEVDDFGAFGLEYAAHYIDGGVMAVKQAGGGDKTDMGVGVGYLF